LTAPGREAVVRIKPSSVLVHDQEGARRFYTGVLGFIKKMDLPAGEFRWLEAIAGR
jgi:hypothetical protein